MFSLPYFKIYLPIIKLVLIFLVCSKIQSIPIGLYYLVKSQKVPSKCSLYSI